MRNLVMGCAVLGLIALSPKTEAFSPALQMPFPMVRSAEARKPAPLMPKCLVGMASWYGSERRGNPTASGACFDENLLAAAHRNFPLGTIIRVTNVRNLESALVKITDRGPGMPDRMIDVS